MSVEEMQKVMLTPQEMTIYEALQLQSQFLEALSNYQQIEVNLANVSEIDSAGIQLMIALKKDALLQQKSLLFTAHSPEVIALLDLFNMTQFFGDPVILGK